MCLSGDVLFAGSIGRTDLPGGDHDTMLHSLATKILAASRPGRGAARPRPADDHRKRTREQPVPAAPRRDRRPRPAPRTVTHAFAFTRSAASPSGCRLSASPSSRCSTRCARSSSCTALLRSRPAPSNPSTSCCARARPRQRGLHRCVGCRLSPTRATTCPRRSACTSTSRCRSPATCWRTRASSQFPFRRYQIQPAWRGERPQEGRYREFVQADIDIVDKDALSFHYEVEIAQVMAEAFARCLSPPVRMQVNNRKLIEGYYRGIGANDVAGSCGSSTSSTRSAPAGVERRSSQTSGCPTSRRAPAWRSPTISGEDAGVR